jgi:hypothetical protein
MTNRTKKYKMGKCTCKNCGVEFEKPLTEMRRNQKLNRPNFCTRTCVGKHNIKNFGDKRFDLTTLGHKRFSDEYSKFRYHFRNIKKRNQIVEVNIEDLKEQWEKQNGICQFSGVNLILSSYSKVNKNPIYAASLDRIDNSKGYVRGNIRWVSRAINWMKNSMSDNMVNELISLLIENKKGSN